MANPSVITSPTLVSLTGNDIIFILGTSNSNYDFYALGLQVQVFDRVAIEWDDIGPPLRVPVNSSNQSKFYVNDILKKINIDHFANPSKQIVSKKDNYVIQYRIRYYEIYGSDQTKYNETTSNSFYAIQGGIGHLTEKKYSDEATTWYGKLQSEKFFLTDMPSGKVTNKAIGEAYFEKLYFLFVDLISAFKVWIKEYYTDKAPVTREVTTYSSAETYKIYEIDASYIRLGVTDANCFAYEIWITHSSISTIILSEKKLFFIDNSHYRRIKYFLFNNKYGLMESLIFTGEYEGNSSHTKEESVDLSSKEVSEYHINEQVQREVSTGLLKPDWFKHLKEFYNSNKKYEFYKNTLIPIVFDTKKLSEPGSENFIFNQKIKYRFAFSSSFNDNIIFLNKHTTPEVDSYTQPATGASNIVKCSTAVLSLDALCYPGKGNIYLLKSSDSSIVQTVAAKDCLFVRDENNDQTELQFVVYNTENSTQYKVDIDFNAIQNQDGLYFENTLAEWNFTMGTTTLAEITVSSNDTDVDNPELVIDRTIGTYDARSFEVTIKLLGNVNKTIKYSFAPKEWTEITIDNNIVNLYPYYGYEITVADSAHGTVIANISESGYLEFKKVEFVNPNDIIIDGSISEEKNIYYKYNGNYFHLSDVIEINLVPVTEFFFFYQIEGITSLLLSGSRYESVDLSKLTSLNSLVQFAGEFSSLTCNNVSALNTVDFRNVSNGGSDITINLSGCNQVASLRINSLQLSSDSVTNHLDLVNKTQLNVCIIYNCSLSQSDVDSILNDLDNSGITNATIDLRNNSIPSAAGLADKTSLESKGCTVYVDS